MLLTTEDRHSEWYLYYVNNVSWFLTIPLNLDPIVSSCQHLSTPHHPTSGTETQTYDVRGATAETQWGTS